MLGINNNDHGRQEADPADKALARAVSAAAADAGEGLEGTKGVESAVLLTQCVFFETTGLSRDALLKTLAARCNFQTASWEWVAVCLQYACSMRVAEAVV